MKKIVKKSKSTKKLSVRLMTEEELIYNECTYKGEPTNLAIKKSSFGQGSGSTESVFNTSICKTYEKITSKSTNNLIASANESKKENVIQKKLSIKSMTEEELIYNKCIYNRKNRPTHLVIKKTSNKARIFAGSSCKTYTKIPGGTYLSESERPQKKLSILQMTEEELIYNKCFTKGKPTHLYIKNSTYTNGKTRTIASSHCKTYTKIPSDKNLAKLKSPQKISIFRMTDEELIYNKCIYTRDGTPTHIAKKNNAWQWEDTSTCKTYTKIPSKSTDNPIANANELKKENVIQKKSLTDEEKIIDYKKIEEEKKIIAQKKAAAKERKRLANKKIVEEKKKILEKEKVAKIKIEEEKKRIAKIKIEEEIQNQRLIASNNNKTKKGKSTRNNSNSKNFLEAIAKNEIIVDDRKKIIRYECQQPWDLTTEDYRPLLDIYELDLRDRTLKGTHRYITDKEYTDERIYPILATDEDRVLVRYDSPNGNFSTKFFFNYGTDQSIVAADNSYKTKSRCVNRDYFVDIKIAKTNVATVDIMKNDLLALELAQKEAILAQKEIEKIDKEQKQLLANQNNILKDQKQKTKTIKVAKLKIYDDPKKLNISLSSSISKSQLQKYNATSTVSYLFFESSENYLISLELLYRAYDLNTDADDIRSHLAYMKDSKSSEKKRLSSTRQIVQTQSLLIRNNIKNESLQISAQGKAYYAQSLPYALNAAISTYNLYHAATNAVKNVGKDGDIVAGMLNNFNNIMGIVKILPQLPSYSKNMYQTTKLIITGAKVRKIKDSANVNKALDELNLET